MEVLPTLLINWSIEWSIFGAIYTFYLSWHYNSVGCKLILFYFLGNPFMPLNFFTTFLTNLYFCWPGKYFAKRYGSGCPFAISGKPNAIAYSYFFINFYCLPFSSRVFDHSFFTCSPSGTCIIHRWRYCQCSCACSTTLLATCPPSLSKRGSPKQKTGFSLRSTSWLNSWKCCGPNIHLPTYSCGWSTTLMARRQLWDTIYRPLRPFVFSVESTGMWSRMICGLWSITLMNLDFYK